MTFTGVLTTFGLIVIGVLLFELIILFHEGGHFIAAKLSKVKVNEFSLGMGPKLFSFKKGETTYSLRVLPIGGFCAMEGEDEDSPNPRAFNNVNFFKRMIIIVAGAFMNIVFGLILMFFLLLPNKEFATTTVQDFTPYAYTANCGLQEGDKIISIDGYRINNSMDLSYVLATLKVQNVEGDSLQIYKQDCANALYNLCIENDVFSSESDKEWAASVKAEMYKRIDALNDASTKENADLLLKESAESLYSYFNAKEYDLPEIEIRDSRQRFRADVVVKRDGEKVTLKDVDFFTYLPQKDSEPQLATDFYLEFKDKTFFTLIGETGSQTVSVVRMVGDSLISLVKGEFGFSDVSGPIGAASATVDVAKAGLETSFGDAVLNIVYVMMVISVNLGIVNMLPFPALDGGRFVFLLIEAIFRKPIPRKVESVINGLGLGLLLIFILIVSLKDVWVLIF
ncbi:MAG: RIP metalloprotease RseP [Ruminococcaceae bacterium]|nr:RIP metalloprotease RseP [Oscillospiraceae bacterium]